MQPRRHHSTASGAAFYPRLRGPLSVDIRHTTSRGPAPSQQPPGPGTRHQARVEHYCHHSAVRGEAFYSRVRGPLSIDIRHTTNSGPASQQPCPRQHSGMDISLPSLMTSGNLHNNTPDKRTVLFVVNFSHLQCWQTYPHIYISTSL